MCRFRRMRLPPALSVWRPRTKVTLSVTWNALVFAVPGPPPDPTPRMSCVANPIVTIPLVRSSRLMPGMPISSAMFSPNPTRSLPMSMALQPKRNSFITPGPKMCVSLTARLWASVS